MSKHTKDSTATLSSLHVGRTLAFAKNSIETAQVELDGFVGDKHRGYMRGAYEGESYPVVRLEEMIVNGQLFPLRSLPRLQKG